MHCAAVTGEKTAAVTEVRSCCAQTRTRGVAVAPRRGSTAATRDPHGRSGLDGVGNAHIASLPDCPPA